MPIEVKLHNVRWSVGDIDLMDNEGNPIAGKMLALNDVDSGITVTVPFSGDKADEVAEALSAKGGIVPMRGMTPSEMKAAAQQDE